MASNKVETTILDGYAKTAEQLLNNHYPEDYTSADVVKLAEYLIDEDLNRAALVKKAALYDSAGRVLCVNMVNSNHEEALEELEKVAKGAYIGPVVSKLKDMIGAGKMSFGKATEWLSGKYQLGKTKAQSLINAAKVRLDPNVSAVGDNFIVYGPGKKPPFKQPGGALVPYVEDGAAGLKLPPAQGYGERMGQLFGQRDVRLGLGAGVLGGGGLGYYMGRPGEDEKDQIAMQRLQQMGGMV